MLSIRDFFASIAMTIENRAGELKQSRADSQPLSWSGF
jgi:hypothetical protein